jgi:hypothetical protein
LPREARDLFRGGVPSAEPWYGLSQIAAYLGSCNQVAVHDDGERWRALGYAGVETGLLTLSRSVRNQTDGYAALREALPILSDLFDFARWGLEGGPQAVRLRASGLGRIPPSLHDWLAGVIEQAARSTGHAYRVALLREGADGEDALEFTATLAGYGG